MNREEFRIDRVTEMERVSADLLSAITDALTAELTGEDFFKAIEPDLRAAFIVQYDEAAFGISDSVSDAVKWFIGRIRPGAEATKADSDPQRIADWLGTAVVNGAKVAGLGTQRRKTWLSRRDDKVRPFHVEADGQTVGWDEPFKVCDGIEMLFPGDPVGDPGCWINCRCVVADASLAGLTAAADEGSTGIVIVAIPAQDDPINAASSEPTPHMTLIWLGTQALAPGELDAINGAVKEVASTSAPVETTVKSREVLGDDNADVAMLDPGLMTDVRDGLMADPGIAAAHDRVEQYPQWTPHVTLGYPDTPATGEPGETIRFDRLAVWDGDYEGEVFPMTTAVDEAPPVEVEEPELDEAALDGSPVPWHGVLVPEGVYSGDGRMFTAGAITWRALPMPLLWQERSGMGHEGSVIVGQISDVWREGSLIYASGTFAATEDADKVIGLMAEGHLRGVSVDVDSAEMAMEDEETENILFSKGRICAATLCSIPAFAEASLSLGIAPPREVEEPSPPNAVKAPFVDVPLPFKDYDTETRKRMAKAGTAMPDGSFPIADADDLSNAIQAIGRAKDPDAAKAHIKKRARALGKTDLIPEGWSEGALLVWSNLPETTTTSNTAVATVEFGRGPGWVTDPIPTKRIHDYWTVPGHEGYAKIAWGTPGDFRRLRAHLAKYIGPLFLNRTTAQWHHDALGYWPGELGKPGNPVTREHSGDALVASVHLVASGGWCAPSEWFDNPGLPGPTPLSITDDGRVFGHLATWGTCHIGIPGVCTEPPQSHANYAYYLTGSVHTEDGREIPVGQITMGTGHASTSPSTSAHTAASHYDNTGSVVADVAAGEDAYGIWVAGALRPDLPDSQKAALRAGALSGDWRSIGGNLELVAALVVNVPGFPIPRTGLAASGEGQTALVAAGIVMQEAGDESDVAEFVRAVADEVENRMQRRTRVEQVLADTKELRVAALLSTMEV